MTRLAIDPLVPPEIAAAAVPVIAAHRYLIPGWVHELYVVYDGAAAAEPGGHPIATMALSPEYRQATLTLCGLWLLRNQRERTDVVRHELLHLALEPMNRLAGRAIDAAPEAVRQVLIEQWRLVLEGAVSDLTEALWLDARCVIPPLDVVRADFSDMPGRDPPVVPP
jgi:hypothetical protein